MNQKKAKAIRRKMKELGFKSDDPKLQTRLAPTGRSKRVEILAPVKGLLGKPDPTKGLKIETVEVPILQLINPYRRIFIAIAKGEYDFERKEIKGKEGRPKAPTVGTVL